MGKIMENDEPGRDCTPGGVKDLQAALFPIQSHDLSLPRLYLSPNSFLGNFLLKTNQVEISEERTGTGVPRLREPRELFAVPQVPTPSQPPRWPAECQVLDERIEHLLYNPPVPEQYYLPTGKEVQPKPVGEEYGTVVFQYYPLSAINYFNRSSVGGSKYIQCTPPDLEDDDLLFESRFESGNLAKAIKLTATFYELYVRTDLYTNRHMQWFYFRVSNAKRHVTYRFSIVNLSKGDSLYNSGMKPLMYSTKDAKLHSIGWRRCGDNIIYFCNDNGNPEEDQPSTYTLTFTVEFPHDKDVVYLAHSYPYTYSDLQDYLTALMTHPVKATFSSLRLLCRSLAGNNVYYVTITSPPVPGETKKKKAVVITARVHPGESPSSWMMKGFLDFLTGDSGPARELRDKFIFKLVPMINPDGVIVGNSRCSLTGRDLNRQYRTVIRETYPSIWHIKLMVRRLIEECGVAMYCDLHAHSRQNNIFIYGCESRKGVDKQLHEQVFPLMLHKNAADKFSFESCKFRVQRCKEGAGRVVMWMMGIANSYTMEASFAGSDLGPRAETHFSTQDYEQMGRLFCQTLLDFYDEAPIKEKLRCKIIKRLLKEGSTADEPTNINLSDYSSDEGDSSSSEEGGRDHYDSMPLIVPPPSPELMRVKIRKKKTVPPVNKQPNNSNKSPTAPRKTLPMCQATLGLSLAEEVDDSSSDSNSGNETGNSAQGKAKQKIKRLARRRKPRKNSKICEHSDTEIQTKKYSRSNLSVVELLPDQKTRSKSWHRYADFPQSRTISDGRTSRNTARQLAEVQAKLMSLRNKIWTGVKDGENGPLSWGYSNFSSHMCMSRDRSKKNKDKKKSAAISETTDPNKSKKKSKRSKDDARKSPKKKQNGFRRQGAVDWTTIVDYLPMNYVPKSIQECTKEKNTQNSRTNICIDSDDKKKKLKKKKSKTKWEKKVQAVTNANVFIRRDSGDH